MKPNTLVAMLAGAAFASPALAIDFTGPAAPANWTTSVLGTLTGASPNPGSAVFSPTQLVLAGGNATSPNPGADAPACAGGNYGFLGPCQIQTTIGLGGIYSFTWNYLTSDASGPGGDIFGVLINGVRTQLSDPGGAIAQSGTSSFAASSSFGWFMNCTDCIGGNATATVSSFAFAQAIPEPSTYGLLLAGLAAVGAAARRRRQGPPSA
jgi:hypothetical protein